MGCRLFILGSAPPPSNLLDYSPHENPFVCFTYTYIYIQIGNNQNGI